MTDLVGCEEEGFSAQLPPFRDAFVRVPFSSRGASVQWAGDRSWALPTGTLTVA